MAFFEDPDRNVIALMSQATPAEEAPASQE
jgi:hypothetical protein